MSDLVTAIRTRYLEILDRIAVAAASCGRDPESVRLVVVTKAQPLETVSAAIEAGAHVLGENYPEEAAEKIAALRQKTDVEWHMIGHIQSRKARLIVENYALVHSVDSLKLANRLDRFAAEVGRRLPVLLEFNVGAEESKYGWSASAKDLWPELLPDISALLELPNLEVRGLMTMPPLFENPEQTRPYFKRLRQLGDYLAGQFPQASWKEFSMGTSADFEAAIKEGSTLVRVGQAIVGPRSYDR
jgi:pyridoxal phosphate enzyme (YggS family)